VHIYKKSINKTFACYKNAMFVSAMAFSN